MKQRKLLYVMLLLAFAMGNLSPVIVSATTSEATIVTTTSSSTSTTLEEPTTSSETTSTTKEASTTGVELPSTTTTSPTTTEDEGDISVLEGNYTYSGCVQWVKDRALSQLGIQLPATGYNKYGLPGASAYWTVLPRHGYQTGSEPAKNAIAVWEHNPVLVHGSYNYGHVAYVENVNGDNVTISQGGVPGSWGGHLGVSNRTYHKSQVAGIARKFLGYVYLRERPIPPAPPIRRHNVDQLAAQTGRSISDGDYHIAAAGNPNFIVDVSGADSANGTNIQLWDNPSNPLQIFSIRYIGGRFL